MSPTEKGRLKGLRQARDLALLQAKGADLAFVKNTHDWKAAMFAMAHAQVMKALARKLQRQINQALRGHQEELL